MYRGPRQQTSEQIQITGCIQELFFPLLEEWVGFWVRLQICIWKKGELAYLALGEVCTLWDCLKLVFVLLLCVCASGAAASITLRLFRLMTNRESCKQQHVCCRMFSNGQNTCSLMTGGMKYSFFKGWSLFWVLRWHQRPPPNSAWSCFCTTVSLRELHRSDRMSDVNSL